MRWKKILSGILVSAMALGAVVSGIPQKALGAENLAGGGTNEITESLLRVNQKGAKAGAAEIAQGKPASANYEDAGNNYTMGGDGHSRRRQ